MPLTVLDPATALLVVDVQPATVDSRTSPETAAVVANTAALAAAFREHGLPVVLVSADLNHPPVGRTTYPRTPPRLPEAALRPLPDIGPEAGDITLTKRGWAPFAGTDLDSRLRGLGVTQVVVTGLATSFGIESTARQAYDLDYHVTVAVDAVTDPFPDRHEHTVASVLPLLAELGTTEEVIALLAAR